MNAKASAANRHAPENCADTGKVEASSESRVFARSPTSNSLNLRTWRIVEEAPKKNSEQLS